MEIKSESVGNRNNPVMCFADAHACECFSSSRRVGDDLKLAALGVEHSRLFSERCCDAIMSSAVGMGVVAVVGEKGD